LHAIVEAAGKLQSQNIKFIFVGEGVEKPGLKARAEQLGLENIQFYDPMPKSKMPDLVANCDVSAIALLTRMPGTMPSKFYEAIAAGSIPLTADGCEAAALVQKYEAGVVYEPGDAKSVTDSLLMIRNMNSEKREQMRSNARSLSLRFDRDRQANFINSCLEALISNTPLPSYDW
jgi:glycosyltransferase involved in cell wall biosynthesis